MKYHRRRLGKRIILLCEGETEVLAVRYFIKKQWDKDGLKSIGLHPIDLRAKLEDVLIKVPLYLKDLKILAVFTIIDLHGMSRVVHKTFDSLEERIERSKEWLRNDFSDEILSKFFPHLSIHEVESWILAEGTALQKRLKDPQISPEENAELIDDQNPPKTRLNAIFHTHGKKEGFKEIRDGTPLFKSLDFDTVYEHCHYFRLFYDELKRIGTEFLDEMK